MAQSFTPAENESPKPARTKRRVLITGAAGKIGSYFAERSHERYDLVLLDRKLDPDMRKRLEPFGDLVEGDITDLARMKEVTKGVDTVVHLAGDPRPGATWDSLLPANIIGTYNVMIAAKAAGVRRFIYASSIHAVSGYPTDVQVKTSEPVNPGDLYGVSKCFGEALGRYMAEKEGLSCIAIRIGGFQPVETARAEGGIGMLDAWVSRRDLNQLIERCIDVENLKFAILHGLSDNAFKRLDISDARELVGYDPVDDLTREHPVLKKLRLDEKLQSHNVTDGVRSGIRKEL
jgi:UDP-glucose 4-epimerase